MASFTSAQLDWLRAHHGVASRRQLSELGLSDRQVELRVASGTLVALFPSAFAVGGVAVSTHMRFVAACASAFDVVVSHASAGRRLGLRGIGTDQRLHLTTSGTARRAFRGCVVHASFAMAPQDVDCVDGVRYTTAARTLFDLAATVNDHTLESMIEQALHERSCSVAELTETADRLAERGRHGSARFKRVLRSRSSGQTPVGSDLELRFERAVLAAGLPRPCRQHPVQTAGGAILHPDFYWPTARLAVEVDHATWHSGRHDRTNDNRRDRLLRAEGIEVRRVTDIEIQQSMPAVISDLEHELIARTTSPPPN
jgi:very-short-patch-repair endonuclease